MSAPALDIDTLLDGLTPDQLDDVMEGLDPRKVISDLGTLSPDELKVSRRIAAEGDFLAFMAFEMAMDIAPHNEVWWNLLKTGEDCVFMAPRDHGKSITIARAYPIFKAKYDPWVKEIYILGQDQESAVENLDKIKELLLSRRALRSLVPSNWKEGFNNRTTLRLTNGTLFRAKSFFAGLRGRHPQLIVCDDVLNERNSDSEIKRMGIEEKFLSVVLPMKDKGRPTMRAAGYKPQVVVVGTAQSGEDLYHHLLGNLGPGLQGPGAPFIGVKQTAIIVDAKWEPILDANGDEQYLWADRYDGPALEDMKRKMGELLFAREFMNKPIVDEMAIFPPSLFEPLKDETLSYVVAYTGTKPVYMGVDFSIPGSQDGDFTVVFCVEYDHDQRVYTPTNIWRARPKTVQEQLHQVEFHAQAQKIELGYVEDNVFQKVYAQALNQRTTLPLQGHTVMAGEKNSYLRGLLGLRPQFESGQWRFPYKTDRDKELTNQLIREFGGIVQRKGKLGNEAGNDDIPMSMWHAWCAANEQQGTWSQDWTW